MGLNASKVNSSASIRYIPPQRIIGRFSLLRLDLLKFNFFIFNFLLISPHGLQHIFVPFVVNASSHSVENAIPFPSSFLPLSLPHSPNLLFLLPISLFSSSVFTPSLT